MSTDEYEAIPEAEWKVLATTEITHLTDEEKDYLPRAWDEWIARVRREAKAEALREAALAILMDSFDASVADRLADAGYTEYAEDEDGGLTWVSAPLSEVLHIVRICATEYEIGGSDEHR